MRKIMILATLIIILVTPPMLVEAEEESWYLDLDRQIKHIMIMQGNDKHKPICVFGGGVGTRLGDAILTAEELYGGPAIGIHAYSGDIIPDLGRAMVDYLRPAQGKETGMRVLKDLEKIYKECGRIDMATFHSAFVVALNHVPEELDAALSSGKLRFDRLALAGAHVLSGLAAVLDKHKEKGNIKDWKALERTYKPDQQRGDLVVLATTPNWEFRSYLGAAIGKALVALDVLSWISGGKSGGRALYYDFSPEHFMETYTPAVRQFFGLSSEKSGRQPELRIGKEVQDIKYKKEERYPFWWPPEKGFATAGIDRGGIFLSTGNTYLADETGSIKKMEEAALKSKPKKDAIVWEFEHQGKKYKARALPFGKKDYPSGETGFHFDREQNIAVFSDKDGVVTFKLQPVGSYFQILQIGEGEVMERKGMSLVFQVTNMVFTDYSLESQESGGGN